MPEKRKVREEFEKLAECNDFVMSKIITMQMSARTIGGGDYVGDIDTKNAAEQFVWNSSKAELGWCIGVHVFDMVRQLLSHPIELTGFKDAILDSLEDYLNSIRDDLEKIDGKGGEDGEDK